MDSCQTVREWCGQYWCEDARCAGGGWKQVGLSDKDQETRIKLIDLGLNIRREKLVGQKTNVLLYSFLKITETRQSDSTVCCHSSTRFPKC